MAKEQQKILGKKTILILVLLGLLLSLITLGLQAVPTSSQDAYLLEEQADGKGNVQFEVKEKPISKNVLEEATVTFTVKKHK